MFQKCLISGESLRNNLPTSYELSNGDINFTSLISDRCSWTLQLAWSGLDASDATFSIKGSNDGTNFDTFYGDSTKTIDSANGSHSFRSQDFDFEYIMGSLTVNSVTAGTITAILTVKPITNAS